MSIPSINEIWRSRRRECDDKLFLVNRRLRELGRSDLQDTERGRVLIAAAVHYEVGPGDTAYQIIDDFADAEAQA